MKKQTFETKTKIPVFFAADENYLPFLAVTLSSIKAHASEEFSYAIHVLYTGKLERGKELAESLQSENFTIEYNDVSVKQREIRHLIHCRDYYTSAIYFRLFIPELFPQYEKAIYLDCDTVVLSDISELYNADLNGNLIGAVADQAVEAVLPFREYTKNALGIPFQKYFNSGVIVMNLKKMRETHFCQLFGEILQSYDFIVAPDQDCLNLICKNKVRYFPKTWNAMPTGALKDDGQLKLIHYNLSMKPWHYDGVAYERYFWAYAKQTAFYEEILAQKQAFTQEMKNRDLEQGERLIALAQAEADSPCNYLKTVASKNEKRLNEGGKYGFNECFDGETGDISAYSKVRKRRAF